MPSAATGRRYPLSVQLIRQSPLRNEALPLQLTNGRDQSRGAGVCCLLGRCPAAYSSPAGQSFPVKLHRAIMAALLAAALFQTEHLEPHKAPKSATCPSRKGSTHGEIQNRKSVSICASDRPPRWRDAWDARNGIGPGWPRGRRGATRYLENSRQQGPLPRRLGGHSSNRRSTSGGPAPKT